MRPNAFAIRLASPGAKKAGPQLITPGVPGAGPAAEGDGPWTGRLRAACWTALHLAVDICPVQGDAGGPADALDWPVRTSPARAAATATDKTAKTAATRPARSREDP